MQVSKRKVKVEKLELKVSQSLKSTIMIEGQKDSETGEVDKGGERTPWPKKEEMKKEVWYIQK